MKRSFFSVVMLALVLAFLYVPILLVFVYAFVPNGLTMSFVGEGLPQYLEESDPGASAEFADASARQEWRTYSKQYRDDFSPQEQAWLASVPKDADGKSAAYDETVRPGEIRLARLGKKGHPFAFLVLDETLTGYRVVPVSPLSRPASARELAADGRVYQLWNGLTPVSDYVRQTWRIGTVDADTVARVAAASDAARPGRLVPADGPLAKYEKHFFASWPKRFLGFTSKWYEKIFSTDPKAKAELKNLMHSFWLSLIVAGLATLISCVIGTTSALALHRWRGRLQSVHHALVYTPLIMPDILIGISLLMLFVACHVDCGFMTILIAHVTFCVSYVVMTLLPRLQDFDDRIVEAAHDLGAGPFYTFFHVELPILLPGIVAGGLLAFTLSIDDVVITSFVNGAGTNTFPTFVSSMTKHSKNLPAAFALSTLMLVFTCVLVGLSKFISRKQPMQKGK